MTPRERLEEQLKVPPNIMAATNHGRSVSVSATATVAWPGKYVTVESADLRSLLASEARMRGALTQIADDDHSGASTLRIHARLALEEPHE